MGFWGSKIYLILFVCLCAVQSRAETVETIETELPFLRSKSIRKTRTESINPPKGFVTNDTFLDFELIEEDPYRSKKRKKRINNTLKTISKYDEFDQFEN